MATYIKVKEAVSRCCYYVVNNDTNGLRYFVVGLSQVAAVLYAYVCTLFAREFTIAKRDQERPALHILGE